VAGSTSAPCDCSAHSGVGPVIVLAPAGVECVRRTVTVEKQMDSYRIRSSPDRGVAPVTPPNLAVKQASHHS
jgi:hypothetical protein